MNILLLGSGGREHALACKITQSPLCTKLYTAPGNAGTQMCGENVDMVINDFLSIAAFIKSHQIKMVVVGPEEPLVKGITDYLNENIDTREVLVIGPGRAGSQLEGSKEFAKGFMARHNIPTAAYKSFEAGSFHEGVEFLKTLNAPYVLKADGLAAGKGVYIVNTFDEAVEGLDHMLNKKAFGNASNKVIIEEFMHGIEVSVFVATDGKDWILLPEAKDYKRIGEGDTGPNTGGMGAVSPVPFANELFMEKVKTRIIQPTIEGLNKESIDYKGFIFIGIMSIEGEPFVVEYNARLGDPETEAIIPRIKSDLVEMLQAIATGTLKNYTIETDPNYAVTIVLVSGGYPGKYVNGYEMTGITHIEDSKLYYAGACHSDNKLVTKGGRVIAITSLDPSLSKAREISLKNAQIVSFQNKNYRKDIGLDLQNE
jgi:phosphoribosylamine---glycine ligase